MALNWVMLPEHNTTPGKSQYIPLPNERTIFRSADRTSLSVTSPKATYPAHAPHITITSNDGTLFLTNQRVIYLPKPGTNISCNVASDFKSFSCPLLNLHDTHLVMPWFGPNAWTALLQPVAGGGMPNTTAGLEIKFTFKEGGAPDFQGKFEAIKERLQQVVDCAREANVSMANVHLDQLPSYQDSGHDRIAPNEEREEEVAVPTSATAAQVRAMAAAAASQRQQEQVRRRSREEEAEAQMRAEAPNDAPPGYEETQQQSVQEELERRLGDGERQAWQETRI